MLLRHLACRVTGYALAPETEPSLFEIAGLSTMLESHHQADIREAERLSQAVRESGAELMIHMAAQPLVRRAYAQPIETWSTNVLGTLHAIEAARAAPSIRAIIVVTTDKCYENHEWIWGYRESDHIGGRDPYSASKAACELVVTSQRMSFLDNGGPLLASVRAGNVIGGGDWSADRLIPDAARAASRQVVLDVRNPSATRPWQHVLDCLHGYLLLADRLLAGNRECARAFNFGPCTADNQPVGQVLDQLARHWDGLRWRSVQRDPSAPHEAKFLYLDSTLARRELGWHPRWRLDQALRRTADWYRSVQSDPSSAMSVTLAQVREHQA